jgi:hypothetical protein
MQRLVGRWAGAYEYLEPKGEGQQRVGFTLEIFGGPSWRLRGHVFDDPNAGMEGQGTISGWSWGRHVWFRKVMPQLTVGHHSKPIPLADYLRTEFGADLAHDPGPHEVSYRGVVAGDQHGVTGTWTTPHRAFVLSSGRMIEIPLTRGIWEMHRA